MNKLEEIELKVHHSHGMVGCPKADLLAMVRALRAAIEMRSFGTLEQLDSGEPCETKEAREFDAAMAELLKETT